MRVLITGMTSRHTNRARHPLMMSALMASAMEAAGHEVVVRSISDPGEPIWDYDAVLVGLSSPLAPSSRYAIPALAIMEDAYSSGTLRAVFLDDVRVKQLWYGTESVLAAPSRLTSNFYRLRPGTSQFMDDPAVRASVMSMLTMIQSGLEGTISVLWPAHPWTTVSQLDTVLLAASARAPGRMRPESVPVDLTPVVLDRCGVSGGSAVPRGEAWIEESSYSSRKYTLLDGLSRPLLSHGSVVPGFTAESAVRSYQLGYGVLQGSTGVGRGNQVGWWTPTPALAAAAGRLYVPEPVEGELMGHSYFMLPSSVENLDDDEYARLLASQQADLEEGSWQMPKLVETLNGVLGSSSG